MYKEASTRLVDKGDWIVASMKHFSSLSNETWVPLLKKERKKKYVPFVEWEIELLQKPVWRFTLSHWSSTVRKQTKYKEIQYSLKQFPEQKYIPSTSPVFTKN